MSEKCCMKSLLSFKKALLLSTLRPLACSHVILVKVEKIFFSLAVFRPSHGTEVTVKDQDGKMCLYASLMVNFSVSYEQAEGKVSVRPPSRPLWPTALGIFSASCDSPSVWNPSCECSRRSSGAVHRRYHRKRKWSEVATEQTDSCHSAF